MKRTIFVIFAALVSYWFIADLDNMHWFAFVLVMGVVLSFAIWAFPKVFRYTDKISDKIAGKVRSDGNEEEVK